MSPAKKSDGLVGTDAAAEALGISVAQFRRITDARGVEPAKTYTNPHYRSGPPAHLWSRRQLAALARTNDVKAARATPRRDAARRAAETRAERLLDQIIEIDIAIPNHTLSEAVALAINHFNARADVRRSERGDDVPAASPTSDRGFLDRITVNYLRHVCTPYDAALDLATGRTGAADARTTMRNRVLTAIAARFSELAEECERQRRTEFPKM